MERWSIGVLEYWSIGVVDCWSAGENVRERPDSLKHGLCRYGGLSRPDVEHERFHPLGLYDACRTA
jgi:hypothetical protein